MKINSEKLTELYNIMCVCADISDGYGEISVKDGAIVYSDEYVCFDGYVESKLDMLNAFLTGLAGDMGPYISEDETYNESVDLSRLENNDAPGSWRFAASIFRARNEILKDVTYMEYKYSEHGWSGEGDSRYDQSTYSEAELDQIYRDIAEEYGKPVEEVDEDDFYEYAGERTGVIEDVFKYTRDENGEEKILSENRHYLEG